MEAFRHRNGKEFCYCISDDANEVARTIPLGTRWVAFVLNSKSCVDIWIQFSWSSRGVLLGERNALVLPMSHVLTDQKL